MNSNENCSRTGAGCPQNEGNGFNYTYSAKEQAELKKLREKYTVEPKSHELSKMEQIHKLDASVTRGATAFAICIGIVGSLIMGFGMSLIMTDLKSIFNLQGNMTMIVGIIIGIIGMIMVLTAYPLYNFLTERKRKKVAPEIIRLTDELLNDK